MNEKYLIIADCLEEDFSLYKKIYRKIARKNGTSLKNTFVITDKSVKQLSYINNNKNNVLMNMKITKALLFDVTSENVKILCNKTRYDRLKEVLGTDEFDSNIVNFMHYTNLLGIKNHPISKALCYKTRTKDGVYITTELTPNKNYYEELLWILYTSSYSLVNPKTTIKLYIDKEEDKNNNE